MALTWPPAPPVLEHGPGDLQVLIALPTVTSAWGRGTWGHAKWGGYDFDTPYALECQAEGVSIERGRNDPKDHIDPGGMRLRAQDPDMQLMPWVTPPDGFRRWRTGVPIKVRTGDGDLFTGMVSLIAGVEEPRPDVLQVVDIDARDPLSTLAASNQLAQADQGAGELAGARIARVIANARPPAWVTTALDPGVATMQATSLAMEALAESWLTADSDGGMLTCTPDGVVRYFDTANGLTADRRVVPQVLFTDDADYGVGWSPADLPGLELWLDASSVGLADGDPVTVWTDQSGNGHHARPLGAAPTFHTAGVGVGPSVRFSKTGTAMAIDGLGAALTGAGAHSVVALLTTGDTSAMGVLLVAPTDDPAWRFLIEYVDPSGFDWGVGGGASLYGYRTPIPSGTQQLWSFIMDAVGTRHDLYQNGHLLTAFTDWGFVPGPMPALGDDVLIGANAQNGGPLDAQVAALLVFDRALSDAERQQVESYLLGKWGGTVVAPPTIVCASSFEISDDAQQVTNRVSIAAKGGTAQVATDDVSVAWYGVKSTQRHDLIHGGGDGFSAALASAFLSRLTRQSITITPLKFDALHSREAWDAAHSLDVGDRVAVHRSRGGHRLDITAGIDEIRHDITPSSWFVTITLSPGTQRTAYTRWGSARWGKDVWS